MNLSLNMGSDISLGLKLADKLLKKNLEPPFFNDASRFCLATLTVSDSMTSFRSVSRHPSAPQGSDVPQ
ncbi:hypothetical protein QPX28_08095, partial [Corynebacterium pseudodiphtheriticum]|uniref:hypothetical protein n=1 Tax=Corynebacterium pseudodiphtheriticum TaxID=37637 RepID=UPI002543C662